MKTNNTTRRQFLKQSLAGTALASCPPWLLAETGSIKNQATSGFKADVEIEFSAQQAYIAILDKEQKTQVQKFYASLLKGPENTLIQLPGNYLGPILNLQKGQKVRVFFRNQLSEPTIIHWHGLHVPQAMDGHPMYTLAPGQQYVYEFEVVNRAGTSIYHSHAHDLTAEQVYRGLAGLIQVSDEQEQQLDLPRGEYDIPLVIQDRRFDQKHQLQYIHAMPERMLGFLGDSILVNGKPNAEFKVKSRAYRFRAVNASNSRIYKLAWEDGTPLTAIGTDGGLLAHPETRPYIMLAPGERVDLWLDFSGHSAGSKLALYSLPYSGAMPGMYEKMQAGGRGMMSPALAQGAKFPLASFLVTEKISDSPRLPQTLVKLQRLTMHDVDNTTQAIPIALSMQHMRPTLNGKSFVMDKVEEFEKVALNSIKWIKIQHKHAEVHNDGSGENRRGGMGMMGGRHGMGGMMAAKPSEYDSQAAQDEHKMGGMSGMMGGMGGGMMEMAHPIHLHGQQFQIAARTAKNVNATDYDTVKHGFIDSGWKDTVLVMPGEEIDIIKPFQDYKGLFLYHCHNLEHEDLGMMRQFLVG